jgi:hypothetical protein
MTLATDYLIAIAALIFAWRLRGTHRLWSLAFVCTALAALLGGTYHGFVPHLAPLAAIALWKATIFSVGFASFFLLLATSRRLAPFAVVKLVLYTSWMIAHDDFVWVIADYGVSLLVLAAIQLAAWLRHRAASAPWILASVAVSMLAAAVQASGLTLHQHFNHNDLYHVIQLVALWLMYRGAGEMEVGGEVEAKSPQAPDRS